MTETPQPPKPDEAQDEEKLPLDPALVEKAVIKIQEAVTGNGLEPERVTLSGAEGETLSFEAYTVFTVTAKAGQKIVPGRQKGFVVGSAHEARQKISLAAEKVVRNKKVRELAHSILDKREDLGFAVTALKLNLDQFRQSFVVHQLCSTCSGNAQTPCAACNGDGKVRCTSCQGQRNTICHSCHGAQTVTTPQGQAPCTACNGRGQIPCHSCHQKGEMVCAKCQSSGRVGCAPCKATGWISQILFTLYEVRPSFRYDAETLPEDVPPLIDELGPDIVTEGHGEVSLCHETKRDEELDKKAEKNELILAYDVLLPWGKLDINLGDQALSGQIFGFNPALLNLPVFLEKLAAPGIKSLLASATGAAKNPVKSLQNAARYRLLAETITFSASRTKKAALQALQHSYPFGMKPDTQKKLIIAADKALKNATRAARSLGLAAGLSLAGLLYFYYFSGGGRNAVLSFVPDILPPFLFDASLLAAMTVLTVLISRYSGKRSLYRAIGSLLPEKERRKIMPRSSQDILWAGLANGGLLLVGCEIALAMHQTAPQWYSALRDLFAL